MKTCKLAKNLNVEDEQAQEEEKEEVQQIDEQEEEDGTVAKADFGDDDPN